MIHGILYHKENSENETMEFLMSKKEFFMTKKNSKNEIMEFLRSKRTKRILKEQYTQGIFIE